MALLDKARPFSVVCDASDFSSGCELLQDDPDGHERVVAYGPCQLKSADKIYPVHNKELLAMKYALVKYSLNMLDFKPSVIYNNYMSVRTATQ